MTRQAFYGGISVSCEALCTPSFAYALNVHCICGAMHCTASSIICMENAVRLIVIEIEDPRIKRGQPAKSEDTRKD